MDSEEILVKINNQKENLPNNPLKKIKNRIKALKNLYKNIKLLQDEISQALNIDLGKSKEESYMTEIGLVLSEISYMKKHCRKFAKPKKIISPIEQFPSKCYKLPSPKGQVLIISPWNYPFMLSIEPLVDAISAGNMVVVKPSETSHHVSAVIDKLIKMTFKNGEVITILGNREKCSLLLDQDFDHIFFTGSTRVGKIVMEKASAHFTPVTLEMGGKSPCIVDETANIPLSAKRIVFGKFLNCGQTCVAPDYIYCHKSVKERLIEELKRQIILQYSVDPIKNKNYPKMINEKQFISTSSLIDENKVIFGGKCNKELLKIEPTILDASFEDRSMQEEIFGPILPIVTFENIDEAIKKVNSMSKPLALYIFSSSKKNQDAIMSRGNFGGGCINDTLMHISTPKLAFGGIKQSGIGAYHGKVGFDTFTHYKSILNKKTWFDIPARYQPMSKFKYFIIKMFLK